MGSEGKEQVLETLEDNVSGLLGTFLLQVLSGHINDSTREKLSGHTEDSTQCYHSWDLPSCLWDYILSYIM